MALDWAVGYNSKELRRVRELVEQHADFFLENWRLIARGIGIHWEDIDEDISVASLLRA